MLTLTVRATTTDKEIEAIPYLDMRQEATERRDDARAVIAEQGDQTVLEYHDINGIGVLFSPAFEYAVVGDGHNMIIETWHCASPERAARAWSAAVKEL